MKVRGKTTVNTQELFVHDSGKREGIEAVHDVVVHLHTILVLNCNNQNVNQLKRRESRMKRKGPSSLNVK